MTAIPTIPTERLLLRPMRASDWDGYWQLMASERARYMGGPFSLRVAWGMFCSDHAMWDLFGSGGLMLEHRENGTVLGQVAVNFGPLFPERELGWMLYPEAEGQGYAFEAARAMLDWARSAARFSALVSYVDPANARSIRLAERLGAKLDAEAPRPDPQDLVYRHFG